MTNFILQPASGTEARRHYNDTVINQVDLSVIREFINEDEYQSLFGSFPFSSIAAWGITRETHWEKIKLGDRLVFARDSHYFSTSIVTAKIKNSNLAKNLWGTDNQGRIWQWMYFFLPVEDINIPYALMNNVVGYSENYVPQGINVLRGEKAENAEVLLLDHHPREILNPSHLNLGSLDVVSVSLRRSEQGLLRRNLFGDEPIERCGICGDYFPIEFLIAAHIKKRAECSNSEKLDIPNIAMPMCSFGCDALFESGYVGVSIGNVVVANSNHTRINSLLEGLVGRSCYYWNLQREPYFNWHLENTFRD